MNRLLQLQETIMTNTAAIGRLETALVQQPDSLVIQANLRSFRKLHESLTEEFQAIVREVGMDVCSYRMLQDRPSVRALSRSLGAFQDAFSTVFESLRSGPMLRRTVSRDGLRATDLHVAYTFPGSFGVMLTLPRERFLFDEWQTKADEAIDIVFNVARSRSSKEVAQVAIQLGRAPIAALYDWAKGNAQNQTGTAVEWNQKTSALGRKLFVQYPEFDELSRSIEETGDEQIQTVELPGILVGADIKSRRFHFVTEDDRDIRGGFTDAISERQKAQLPARYVATLSIKTKVNFATAEEKSSYDLLHLAPRA
jgi:hypothetical protein